MKMFSDTFALDSEATIGCNMSTLNSANNKGTYRFIMSPDGYEA
jgi:hypothetical protein